MDGGLINDEFPVENGEVPLPDWAHFSEEEHADLDDERRYDVPVTVIT